jgi:penicillin-binding protein 1A
MLSKILTPSFFTKSLWAGGFIGITSLLIFFWVISIDGLGELPSFETLENPPSELASEVLTSDHHSLGKYFRTNRTFVNYENISPNVIKSLIATEDSRFEKHSGIDQRATFRVLFGIISGKRKGGGSTISQQLAKNLFRMRESKNGIAPPNNKIVKFQEWVVAKRLERAYTKLEIITMYLNTVNFGYVRGVEIQGINEAARTYFNTTALDLKLEEAAILIGMLKAPTKYNPIRNPENAFRRRNVVFLQLHLAGFLTKEEKETYQETPLNTNPSYADYNSGIAPYFRGQIKNELTNILKEQGRDLYSEGYKIYTTINYEAQKAAEKAVFEHMKYLQKVFKKSWKGNTPWTKGYITQQIKKTDDYKNILLRYKDNKPEIRKAINKKRKRSLFVFSVNKIGKRNYIDTMISLRNETIHNKWLLRVGFLAIQPNTGAVKAWVGGIDKTHFQYDNVRQSRKQPGSTFKPVLYSAAIVNGYQPCDTILDAYKTIMINGEIWKPKSKPTGNYIHLKTALAKSLNNIAAYLIDEIGPENVIKQAQRLGIDTTMLEPNYSLALGTSSLSIWDLIGAYTSFVNAGRHIKPFYISRIEDKNGQVIYRQEPRETIAMSPNDAFKMVMMLREGVKSGTSRALNSAKYGIMYHNNQLGGKTGTTNNSADGWYFGISNQIVCGIWVGGEDKNIHFPPSNVNGQGARMAMPIFGNFLKACYSNPKTEIKEEPFTVPKNLSDEEIYQNILCEEIPLFEDEE